MRFFLIDTSTAPNLHELAWLRLSPSQLSMASAFLWMICKERSFYSIFGPPGANPAAKRCRIFEMLQRNFRASRW